VMSSKLLFTRFCSILKFITVRTKTERNDTKGADGTTGVGNGGATAHPKRLI